MKKKSTEHNKVFPYITTLLCTSLWTFYGLLKPGGLLIFTVNGAGAIFQFIYVTLFLLYCPHDKKVMIMLNSFHEHSFKNYIYKNCVYDQEINYLTHSWFLHQAKTAKLVAILDIGFLGSVIAVTLLLLDRNLQLTFTGILCSALTIGMYASPLAAMVKSS